ncbi:radical SAM superfamily enzyme YgiQ (UPF0313 family) [Bacteriovorax stolpii]|nr:radical SAM superfamily enzyme YgiQ (UPF0313 family) [Bacteriovorax stolpii]
MLFMNIVIINPPDKNTIVEFPDEKGDSFLEADDYGYFPPLGALYVLSYLEKNTTGHNLHFIDCVAEQVDHDALIERLKIIQPDVLGMTSFTISLVDIKMVAENVKANFPNCHICLGGHHAISYPNEAAAMPNIDSIVVGEGEKAFTDLVNCLEKKESIEHILGVYTKESIKRAEEPKKDNRFLNSVIVNPAYVDDVDTIPIPNRKFIKHIKYSSILGVSSNLATIISSRGCPYLCTFCNVPYKKYRARSPKLIADEIEECLKLGYDEFHFYDDLFNITPKRLIEICEEFERRELKITWDFRGRVNSLTKEALAIAKKNGCRLISFGVETGSDEGLKVLKKGCNVEKIQNAFRWCRELGIISVADYMIGLPHERSEADIIKNIQFLVDLDPDYAQFNIMTLYPHTEAYDQAVAKGLIEGGRWQKFAMNPTKDFKVDHWEEYVPMKRLVELHKYAYRKFYFRPRYIFRSAVKTKSPFEFMSKFRGALKILRT